MATEVCAAWGVCPLSRSHDGPHEARPTPVEPEALATTRFTLAQALIGSELIARLLEYSKTDDDPRQLAQSWANRIGDWLDDHNGTWAVEPDGLPLDVPRLLRAMRDHCHDSADEGLPILLRHKHLDPFIRDDCGEDIAAEYARLGAPSEDEQPR